MKLDIPTPEVSTAGLLKEHLFSVGDSAIIFDILRNKIYSNPVEAVVREISANARDAHREIGKPNLPIKISLPNSFSPELRIQDFGPGISPERIEDIYVKYGTSSKRENNTQQGAFGLGAKSIFSLVNSFSIITITNKICRTYIAYIDETRVGKIALSSAIPTEEENGTTIIIPIKQNQIKQVVDAVHKFTAFWDVQPEVIGGTLPPLPNTVIECSAGKLINGRNDWLFNRYEYQNIIAVLDGIPYNTNLRSKVLGDRTDFYLCLRFDVGELPVSASRDTLQLTEATEIKLKNRLAECEGLLIKELNDKIKNFPTYKEAAEFVAKSDLMKLAIGHLKWKEFEFYSLPGMVIERLSIYNRADKGYVTKHTYRREVQFKFGKDVRTVINESGCSVSVKKIQKEFESFPDINRIQVITYITDIDELMESGPYGEAKAKNIKAHRKTLEQLADGKIAVKRQIQPKKKKVIKKPKLIFSFLPNENLSNVIKTEIDMTQAHIYCEYDLNNHSICVANQWYEINTRIRMKNYQVFVDFLGKPIICWDKDGANSPKIPKNWIPLEDALLAKAETIPGWQDLVFDSDYYYSDNSFEREKQIATLFKHSKMFGQLLSQIELYEKNQKDYRYKFNVEISGAIWRHLTKIGRTEEMEEKTIKTFLQRLSTHYPLFKLVSRNYFLLNQEDYQELSNYIKWKDNQK